MSMQEEKLGLKELVAIGVGSMIGGGIFSVMGMAEGIAGTAAPLVFLLGGIIALLAGYNYAKLALTFREDGASYTYIKAAFPSIPYLGGLAGWSVLLGYIGTLALYAYTFGAYGAAMLGVANSYWVKTLLGLGIMSLFLVVNIRGIRSAGRSEDIIVYIKIVVMVVMGVAGLFFVNPAHFEPLFSNGVASLFLGGAIVFVAFEGFQLIANSVVESEAPERNIPRGIYYSILIVTLIYIVLSITVMGALESKAIQSAHEYAVAEALRPIFGHWGFYLAALAALLATSSAINGTLFGASRMMADIAKDEIFPSIFSHTDSHRTPENALFLMFILASLFVIFGKLADIVAFSSMTFLVISLAISIANWRLASRTKSSRVVAGVSILLMVITWGLMIVYLWHNEPGTLDDIVMIYLMLGLTYSLYHSLGHWKKRNG
jgi:amino acid transporter